MIWLAIGAVAAWVVIGFGWRFASRHRQLPCPVWLRWLVELDNPFTKTTRAATIVEHLAVAPGMRVLDVGCGPGRVTVPLARAVGKDGEVIAIDVQLGMLERARSRMRAAGLTNVRFLECAVGRDAIGIGDADRAVLVCVLGEIPDQASALRAIFAALRSGGVLSITETVFDPHYQRRTQVAEFTRGAGFEQCAYFGNRLAYTFHVRKP